jgi:hypothetical protein
VGYDKQNRPEHAGYTMQHTFHTVMTEYGKRHRLTTTDSLKSIEQKVKETREKRKKVLAEVEQRRRRNWLGFRRKQRSQEDEF